jgi:drug/metabolite transporter (DMT)-like permease
MTVQDGEKFDPRRWGRFRLYDAGVFWGLIGVFAFSLTVPLTRVAAPVFGAVVAGLGRTALAALFAAASLLITSQPRPTLRNLPMLTSAGLGLFVGYPLCLSLGLETVPSIHGAVTSGLLPLATAVAAAVLAHERLSAIFWAGTIAGVGMVLAYALTQSGGSIVRGDAWLLCAVVSGGLGNASGGVIARKMGGWQTICWGLVIVAPITFAAVFQDRAQLAIHAPLQAWFSLLYLAVVSSLLAFCAWVKGLSIGGIARIGQLQLLQPFAVLACSATLLGEHVTFASLMTSLLVLVCAVACLRSHRR